MERIEQLERKRAECDLSENENIEFESLRNYVDQYDLCYSKLGEEGELALRLWRLLDGQRITGFASIGDISYQAIEFIFNLYDIDDDAKADMFERILKIDGVIMEMRERKGG